MQDEQQIISPFLSGSDSKLYQYKMKLEQVKTELLKFGLTLNQAKVFIYLGKYGPKTAPEVSKSLEMPRTGTYHLINTLQNRGIVKAEFSLPTKYSALSIGDTILTLLNSEQEKIRIWTNQKQELAELWNEIPSFMVETSDTKKENMQMLQGTPQIHNKIKELINHTNEELLIFCTEKDLSRFYYADFTELFSNLIADVKIIISPAQIMPQHAKGIDKKKIKIMPDNKNENQCFLIRDSNEVLFFLRNANHPSHNIFAICADSRSLVDSMHMLFDLCWDKSEPVY